jgi:uncharacterized membrane protein YedE/YeeE
MTRRELVVAFAAGLLFAVGLGVAGMTQPAKVIGFLDVFGGRWDPSLALVMAGALAVYLPAYQWLSRRRGVHEIGSCGPVGVETVDRRVLTGAAIFGVGWGLGGYCPGPAVVSAASGGAGVLLFLAAMAGGMALHDLRLRRRVAVYGAGGAAAGAAGADDGAGGSAVSSPVA